MYGSYSRHIIRSSQEKVNELGDDARKAAEYVKENPGVPLKTLHSLFGVEACNYAVELRSCYRVTQGDATTYQPNL